MNIKKVYIIDDVKKRELQSLNHWYNIQGLCIYFIQYFLEYEIKLDLEEKMKEKSFRNRPSCGPPPSKLIFTCHKAPSYQHLVLHIKMIYTPFVPP